MTVLTRTGLILESSTPEIKKELTERGIQVKSFNGSLIREPWEVLKEDKTPYKVFTALYKKAYFFSDIVVKTLKKPIKINFSDKTDDFNSLDSLKLLPKLPWADNIIRNWKVGEEEANLKADNFFVKGIKGYKDGRNFPFKKNVSFLSPHIHFGEISPKQLWVKANNIENNQLVKPKIPDPIITELVKPKVSEPIIANEDIDPQLEKLNELENRVSTIEKRLGTVRCCIGIQLAVFAINFIVIINS
jgi:deoxyribodipyrimidine photolyase